MDQIGVPHASLSTWVKDPTVSRHTYWYGRRRQVKSPISKIECAPISDQGGHDPLHGRYTMGGHLPLLAMRARRTVAFAMSGFVFEASYFRDILNTSFDLEQNWRVYKGHIVQGSPILDWVLRSHLKSSGVSSWLMPALHILVES
jgi:hypothetical protein